MEHNRIVEVFKRLLYLKLKNALKWNLLIVKLVCRW
jgi:hypothetical protein